MKILKNKANESLDTKDMSRALSAGDGIGFKLVSGARLNNYVTAANELVEELEKLGPNDRFAAARAADAREYIEAGYAEAKKLAADLQQLSKGITNARKLLSTLEDTLNVITD